MGVIMCMATLTMGENTRMGREALHRVETQWGRQQFQRVKEGINHFYVTNKGMAETEAFGEDFTKWFNTDLMRLGEAVQLTAMKLKRSTTAWPKAREARQLPEPVFKGTAT